MWLVVAAFLALLAAPGSQVGAAVHALNITSQVLPALVCWLCVRAASQRRTDLVWLAVAETAFACGNVVLALAQARGVTLPVPSLADAGYMSFYPAALVALVLAARREHRSAGAGVWLDSCVGGLAAASVVAVLLEPAFSGDRRSWWSAGVSLAYPVGDLLLVFAVVAVAGLRQGRLGPRWSAVLVGLAVFTGADVVYDLQIAHGAYVVGTPLDAGWALGLATLTYWAARPDAAPADDRPAPGALAHAVPGVAAAVGLAVLVTGTLVRVSPVATVLAAAAIAGSAVRAQRGLRDQQRLGELRREAQTLERLVQAQDAERARIADDVHDDSIQALAAVDLRLGALRRRLRTRAPDEVEGLDASIDAVHQAALRLRSLLFELETPAVEAELPQALREAADHIFGESEIRWSVVEQGQAPLPVPVRVSAYRIAREAMVNVRKHSAASSVDVVVDARTGGVQVEVVDDGVGVRATSGRGPGRRHMGVVGMRDRAAAAGGWWRSGPAADDSGTCVVFFLPTPAAPG
jgi:signal transduction histidine kinase